MDANQFEWVGGWANGYESMQMYGNESSLVLELIRLPHNHWRSNESERPYWTLSQRMEILTNLRHVISRHTTVLIQ